MEADARALLDQIDAFLLRRDTASAQVAAVLTALRSIDTNSDDDRDVKSQTTVPIRRAAFPRLTADVLAGQDPSSVGTGYDAKMMAMKYPKEAWPETTNDTDRTDEDRARNVVVIPNHLRWAHGFEHVILAASALDLPIRFK